jgi:hypothetical protein
VIDTAALDALPSVSTARLGTVLCCTFIQSLSRIWQCPCITSPLLGENMGFWCSFSYHVSSLSMQCRVYERIKH